jgi:hypothetical protein
MRMIEVNLFPVMPQFYAQHPNREVTSMSDYADNSRHSKGLFASWNIESRLMFGACYLLFLLRAMLTRIMPWRRSASLDPSGRRESIFREASGAARVLVASAFMGL